MRGFLPFLIASVLFFGVDASSTQADLRCLLPWPFPKKEQAPILSPEAIAESKYLGGFKVSEITKDGFKILSEENGVFRIRLKNGDEYVVRMPTAGASTQYEKFAADFMLSAPNVRTPKIRSLEDSEALDLLNKVEELDPEYYAEKSKTHEWKSRIETDKSPISITRYYPDAKMGGQHIADIKVKAELEDFLIGVSENPYYRDPDARYAASLKIEQFWYDMSPGRQTAFLRQLKAVTPLAADLSVSTTLTFLLNNLGNLKKLNIGALYEAKLAKIPPDLRTQIADHWVIFMTLGIGDFHRNNWMMHQGRVMAVDMALIGDIFKKGEDLLPMWSQNPFGHAWISKRVQSLLKESLSKEMKSYLKGLNKKKILEIAKQSGFDITNEQIKGILKRRDSLLEPI